MEIIHLLIWVLIGGLLFVLLSYAFLKFKNKQTSYISFMQDFISGGIAVTLATVLIPSYFPQLPTVPLTGLISVPAIFSNKNVIDDEIQVKIPEIHTLST